MEFTCKGSELMNCISISEKAVSPRSSLPVLENLYLRLVGSSLVMRGNDLEIGIQSALSVEGSRDGEILIRSKTFSNIISKLQAQYISVTVDDKFNVVLKADNRVDYTLLGASADDYPVFPDVENGVSLTLPVETLRSMIAHTIFSVSFDETKPFLNGILLKSDGDKLNFVATDGYRLSMKTLYTDRVERDFSIIAPYKAMSEFNKVLGQMSSDTNVELMISDNQVAFRVKDVLFVSRIIQGQFPDYRQVLPKEVKNQFSLSRRDLLAACERASIIALASNNVVRMTFSDDLLTIRANASGMGEFSESVSIRRESGDDHAKIAFNVRLILDSIKNLTEDDLVIEFNDELAPCVLRPKNDTLYTYIIMPIRTSDYQDTDTPPSVSESPSGAHLSESNMNQVSNTEETSVAADQGVDIVEASSTDALTESDAEIDSRPVTSEHASETLG